MNAFTATLLIVGAFLTIVNSAFIAVLTIGPRKRQRPVTPEDPRNAIRLRKEEDALAEVHFDRVEEYRNDFGPDR